MSAAQLLMASLLETQDTEERRSLAAKLVETSEPGFLAESLVVGKLWSLVVSSSNNPETMIGNAVLPGVLAALAELALPRHEALIGQQLSSLKVVLSIVRVASEPTTGSRSSPEREALAGGMRWLAAVSTHPVTKLLVDQGITDLIRRSLSLRVDDEILIHTTNICANVAADHPDLAVALCRATIPRLLARLVCEPSASAEAKDRAVIAVNRVTKSLLRRNDHDDTKPLPDALADLSGVRDLDYPCWTEGVWGLHILSQKGGDTINAKLKRRSTVINALKAHTTAAGQDGESTPDQNVALARKVAAMTLNDIMS